VPWSHPLRVRKLHKGPAVGYDCGSMSAHYVSCAEALFPLDGKKPTVVRAFCSGSTVAYRNGEAWIAGPGPTCVPGHLQVLATNGVLSTSKRRYAGWPVVSALAHLVVSNRSESAMFMLNSAGATPRAIG
jgi:hypothetical protein